MPARSPRFWVGFSVFDVDEAFSPIRGIGHLSPPAGFRVPGSFIFGVKDSLQRFFHWSPYGVLSAPIHLSRCSSLWQVVDRFITFRSASTGSKPRRHRLPRVLFPSLVVVWKEAPQVGVHGRPPRPMLFSICSVYVFLNSILAHLLSLLSRFP